MEGAARGAARQVAQCPVQPSGSERRLDEPRHSPRLRRPSILLARLLRVQDGAAVRLREVHARRGRRGPALPGVVEHSESRGAGSAARAGDLVTCATGAPSLSTGGCGERPWADATGADGEASGTAAAANGARAGVQLLSAL